MQGLLAGPSIWLMNSPSPLHMLGGRAGLALSGSDIHPRPHHQGTGATGECHNLGAVTLLGRARERWPGPSQGRE